jgi:hypothetical protein
MLVVLSYASLMPTSHFFRNVAVTFPQCNNERRKMPGGRALHGVGPKEQRQYEHIKDSAIASGRYGSTERAKQVAAATVLKHHKEKGHAKDE